MKVAKYKLGVVMQRAPVTLCQVVIGMVCSPKMSSETQLTENNGQTVVMAVQSFSSRPASSTPGSTTDNAELSFSFTASDSVVYTAEKPNFPPVAHLVVDNAC